MTIKHDAGKWRLSLIPVSCLRNIVSVLEYGAAKYTHNVLPDIQILRSTLCEKLGNVWGVPATNLSLQKNYAAPATELHQCIPPNASTAGDFALFNPNNNCVALVTKEIVSVDGVKKLPLSRSISYATATPPISEKEKGYGKENAETIRATEQSNSETLSLETWLGTEYRKSNTTFFWKKVVASAEVKSARTWTMTIELDGFEISFVVSATKDWDCFRMILILCEMLWNTSLSIEQFSTVVSGADNWKTLPDARRRYYDAAIRHLTAWWDGECNDPESNLPHLAHAACCIIFLLWLDDNPQTREHADNDPN